jgi:hypothetical protein
VAERGAAEQYRFRNGSVQHDKKRFRPNGSDDRARPDETEILISWPTGALEY